MKAITIDGKIKTYSSIPTKWKHDGQNYYNYDKYDTSIHYDHGWRDLVVPVEHDPNINKLKEVYFDEANDNYTYVIGGLTPEELEGRKTGNEINELYDLISTLVPFEKVVLRQAGFIEVLNEGSLYEAFVILSNLSPSGNVKTVKDQMMIILAPYETPLK